MAKDPVCQMECDPKTAAATTEYKGQRYYFCAPGCRAALLKDPEKYVHKAPAHGGGSHHQHGH